MSLEDTLSQFNVYDAKKYFRKAQNMVYSYSDVESKVREATNNEPWGASSTLMEQIAQATYNFKERGEVLALIVKRFTEKQGNEWRQIYKALQLLEYLVKRGSEKFIDDSRSVLRLVQLLESFHYIDSQGRDQGVNVRNKAKQLVELLQDDTQLRQERKKARETHNKYQGIAGGAGAGSRTTNLNPHAGFTTSTAAGISVSADFDSDQEEENDQPYTASDNTRFTFSDEPAVSAPAGGDLLQDEAQNNNDEDDDEFGEFQLNTGLNNAATTPQQDLFADLSAVNTTTNANASHTPVVPAIAQPKTADPFSSLFTNAKTWEGSTTANTPPTNTANTNNSANDDDDLFGDLTSAQPTTQTAKNDGEIDLLSF